MDNTVRWRPLSTSRINPGHVPVNAEAGKRRFATARRGKAIGFTPRRRRVTDDGDELSDRRLGDFCCKRGHFAILPPNQFPPDARSSSCGSSVWISPRRLPSPGDAPLGCTLPPKRPRKVGALYAPASEAPSDLEDANHDSRRRDCRYDQRWI
jgi:hypothetical protein